MSRKTKQSKKIADYRKRLQLLESQKRREESIEIPIKVSKKKTSISQKTPVQMPSYEKEKLKLHSKQITQDLKKTVLLSIMGIGVLFGLYFYAPF